MAKAKDNLMKGETLIYEGKQHWSVLACPALFTLFMLPASFMPEAVFIRYLLGGGLIWLAVAISGRQATELVVTNKRVILNTGIVSKSNTDIPLAKIETIKADSGLLGVGTITLVGSGGTAARIKNMANVDAFKNAIQEQIQ